MNTFPDRSASRRCPASVRAAWLAAAALGALPAAATVRSWPGPAPCAAGLQACIDGATSGDEIELQPGEITSPVAVVDKSLVIRARAGASHPVFGRDANFTIRHTGAAAAPMRIVLQRLAFDHASVVVFLDRASGDELRFEQLAFDGFGRDADGFTEPAIRITKFATDNGAGPGQVSVLGSRFSAVPADFPAALGGTLGAVVINQIFDGPWPGLRVRITDNRVTYDASGVTNSGTGFALLVAGDGGDVEVRGNVVHGRNLASGISIAGWQQGGARAMVASNSVANTGIVGFGVLLDQGARGANSVVGNTVVGFGEGVKLQRGATSRVQDNILQDNGRAFGNDTMSAGYTVTHNLLWGEDQQDGMVAGTDILRVDPLLQLADDLRLDDASPAIDAALGGADSSRTDAQGLRRTRGLAADLGAFEHGDFMLQHRVALAGPRSTLADARLAAGSVPRLVTRVDFPDAVRGRRRDTRSVSFAREADGWSLATDDGTDLYPDTRYNVWVPDAGPGVVTHVANAANTTGAITRIDPASGVDGSTAIVLVTPARGDDGTAPRTHRVFARQDANGWAIENGGGVPMPLGAAFHVYAQAGSANAFLLRATHIDPQGMVIVEHPSLDGDACAAVVVAPALPEHGIGLEYRARTGRWAIRYEDGAAIALDTPFRVLIDPRGAQGCTPPPPGEVLFADSFED